jgi:hypothetical protein
MFNKTFGEKLGYDEDKESVDVNIWMLDKDVDKWDKELKM